jgi:hypothetical protein
MRGERLTFPSWYATPGKVARKAGGDNSANWMGIYAGIKGGTVRRKKVRSSPHPMRLEHRIGCRTRQRKER